MEKFYKGLGMLLIAFVSIIIVCAIWGFIILWAWNTFMPAVFNLPQINLIQAFALSLLTSLVRPMPVKNN